MYLFGRASAAKADVAVVTLHNESKLNYKTIM